MIRAFVMILLLCVPVAVAAQIRYSDPTNRNLAKQMCASVEQNLKMLHRYFSWIGVRRGRMLVEVHGPGGNLTVTRRFVGYGLEEIAKVLVRTDR